MRTAPLLVLALIVAAPAFAQDVTLTPKLRAGDGFQLEVVRTRENSARPQQNSTGTTLVDVRVISACPDGFLIEWVPGDTAIHNTQAAQDPLVRAASQALRDIKLRLKLNADGELMGMANRDDVVPKLKAMVDLIISELSARIPEAQRNQFLGFIGQVLSPDVLLASATRDAGTYFGLNSVSLTPGKAVEVDIEQPNPLGSGSIPAKFKVQMVSATADSASLRTTTTYDAEALARITASLAKHAGSPIPPEELAKLPPMVMADDGVYVYDREVGLMREVIVSRRVSVGANRRLDGWQIRLLKGPVEP